MQTPPTATGTRVVVARRNPIDRMRWKVFGILALVDAIVGSANLVAGLAITCYSYHCHSTRVALISIGSCFLFVAACFLVAAVVLHKKTKTATRMDQSNSVMQPVIYTPGYLSQPIITFPTVTTQYPSLYYSPTGPSNNLLSPAAIHYPLPASFTGSPQATEAYLQEDTKPPPYSP